MSTTDDALNGITVSISGSHKFTVTNQKKVIARAQTIMIFMPGQQRAKWVGQDTGSAGQPVTQGTTVFVNNVESVVFET